MSQTSPLPPGTVPNHLVWAILATLLCCLPLGIVSIVKAADVNGKLAAGDLEGAQASSEAAKQWAIWSAVSSLVLVGGAIAIAIIIPAIA